MQGGDIDRFAEPLGHFNTAAGGHPTRRHNGMKITPVPLRNATVMQDDPQDFFLEYAFAENFDRRDADPLLKYLFGIGRDAARHLTANIGHMSEHGRPVDQPAVLKHGHAHQPVVGVADGAVTLIGV